MSVDLETKVEARDRPGGAVTGLLGVNSGRVVEIHRDWALIGLAQNGSQHVFDRCRAAGAKRGCIRVWCLVLSYYLAPPLRGLLFLARLASATCELRLRGCSLLTFGPAPSARGLLSARPGFTAS